MDPNILCAFGCYGYILFPFPKGQNRYNILSERERAAGDRS